MLTAPVVLLGGTPPDVPAADVVGPALPVAAEPSIDAGGDRLVVVTHTAALDRPSPTLLAAQQLSDEADRHPHRTRGPDTPAAARRRHRQRALVAQRRADRLRPADG